MQPTEWLNVVDEDERLVKRCLAGQDAAQGEFVDRFRAIVFGVCYRMLGNRHDAEDVAQEVFLRAFRALTRWDSARPLRPWLLAIAANRCRTFLSRWRNRQVSVEPTENLVDPRPGPDASGAEIREELAKAVDALRPEYRQVFLLYHEQGLTYEEMSELVDKPIGTLKTWLHRARAELLAKLNEKGLTPERDHDLSGV